MELFEIQILIDKYLEGETSLQEESQLEKYFTSGEVHPSLSQYSALFSYFDQSRKEGTEVNLPSETKASKSGWRWLSIAASFTLIFSLFLGRNFYEKRQAELAFNETQRALSLISSELNKGTQAMAQLGTIKKTSDNIFNNEN